MNRSLSFPSCLSKVSFFANYKLLQPRNIYRPYRVREPTSDPWPACLDCQIVKKGAGNDRSLLLTAATRGEGLLSMCMSASNDFPGPPYFFGALQKFRNSAQQSLSNDVSKVPALFICNHKCWLKSFTYSNLLSHIEKNSKSCLTATLI